MTRKRAMICLCALFAILALLAFLNRNKYDQQSSTTQRFNITNGYINTSANWTVVIDVPRTTNSSPSSVARPKGK